MIRDVPGGRAFVKPCRSCGVEVEIRQVLKSDGSDGWHPYDMVGTAGGNVSHFSTCPAARKWRGGKRPAEAFDPESCVHQWDKVRIAFGLDGVMVKKSRCVLCRRDKEEAV